MLSELDKLIGCFYISKFNKEADCFLQDSIRMGLEPAKNLIRKNVKSRQKMNLRF